MSAKTKSLVHGYVRRNYRLYVPEVIIKKCLLFYDPEVTMKFKAKDFQKFLESTNGHCYKKKIKFNHQLSFIVQIYPNGPDEGNQTCTGFVRSSVAVEIENVDYFTICYEILCVETQSFIVSFQKIGLENNYTMSGNTFWLSSSHCKQQKGLTFKFIIHSLEMKYKTHETDENKNNPLFYPSLKARMLKQETSLKWNIDMKRMKNFATRQYGLSQLMDNWIFGYFPKGYRDENGMFCTIHLRSWPLKISKMVFTVKHKISINSDIVDEEDWELEFLLDDRDNNTLGHCMFEDNTIELEQIEDMTFNATVIIKQLYDLEGIDVPIEKWQTHNVQISSN